MNIYIIPRGKRKLTVFVAIFTIVLLACGYMLGNKGNGLNRDAAVGRVLPIYGTDDETMRVSLTINCAWGAQDIPDFLEVLKRYNVRATFFVVGTWAEKYPDMVKRIYDAGHEIGNHSYSHRLPSQSTQSQLENEIQRCNEIVEQITGVKPVLYRAPSGDYTEEVIGIAHHLGMASIKWTADSVDWKKDITKKDLVNRILNRTQSGGILLFHNDTQYTLEALPEILEQLSARGFSFVTVSDLIYQDNYEINAQGIQVKKH